MAKDDALDLLKFLDPYPTEKQQIFLSLRNYIWDSYPTANELIYDNYNALVSGFSLTDRQSHIFCSVAMYRTGYNIHFGFYWGNELSDPEKKLIGEGNRYRYFLVKDLGNFPYAYFETLVKEAYDISLAKVKDPKQLTEGKTIVKMISATKRVKKLK
jgi:hypothetical protein